MGRDGGAASKESENWFLHITNDKLERLDIQQNNIEMDDKRKRTVAQFGVNSFSARVEHPIVFHRVTFFTGINNESCQGNFVYNLNGCS